MKNLFSALIAGLLFGFGLVISGMANPEKVLGFLTLGPGWDPSLALVMAGALLVTVPGFAWLRRRGRPFLALSFTQVAHAPLDRPLIMGALVFGIGWGLAGYCPGPALVSAGLMITNALWFVPAMLLGAWLAKRLATN